MWQAKLIELSEQAQAAPTSEVFWETCHQALNDLGVSGVLYGVVPNALDVEINGLSNAGFFYNTYPDEWISAVEDTDPIDNDLVSDLVACGVSEVLWGDYESSEQLTKEQQRQFELDDDVGLRYGASLSLDHSPRGGRASGIGLWVEGARTAEDFNHYWAEHREWLRQMSHILDEGLRDAHADFLVQLTPREKDCLTYLSIGLRPVEICFRLRISEKTFEKYIKGAKSKLRARTRDHAIAKALVLGVIHP